MLVVLASLLLSSAPIGDNTCGLWEGTIKGNDPHVTARLLVCRRGSELCGQLQWAGQSGESVRELAGTVGKGGLDLHDTRFLKNQPARGWRFCLADGYRFDLNETTGALSGRYWSTACNDQATISLTPYKRAESPMIVSCFASAPARARDTLEQ